MNCIQVIVGRLPCARSSFPKQVPQHYKTDKYTPTHFGTKLPKILKLTSNAFRHQHAATVCLFGGKGKPEDGNQDSPWKAIERAAGSFGKGKSVEDVLRQQIQKQEFFDDGDNAGNVPPSDGNGGGGGGGDGFGDDENEGFWEEFGQVTMATLGFVFLYIYIIEGEEINAIIKDTLKFLFTRQSSIRLNRLVSQCQSFLERMMEKEEYEDPYWLEREILNTRTWFDGPEKYRYIIRALDQTHSEDEETDEAAPFISYSSPPSESDGASENDDDDE